MSGGGFMKGGRFKYREVEGLSTEWKGMVKMY